MKIKNILLYIGIYLIVGIYLLNVVSAIDIETVISCGGDAELMIGCIDDNENSPFLFQDKVTGEIKKPKQGKILPYFLYFLIIIFMLFSFILLYYQKKKSKK